MLVDQDYSNVLSLFCELCECLLYLRRLGLMVNDKEVSLCIRWLGNVADACKQQACDRTLAGLENGLPKLDRACGIDVYLSSRGIWKLGARTLHLR
jgi:hypothetical protein